MANRTIDHKSKFKYKIHSFYNLGENRVVNRTYSSRLKLKDRLISKVHESSERRDYLAKAAYFLLEARIAEDEKLCDFCLSGGYVALAIFCKHHHLLKEAADYYELASEIYARDAKSANTAQLQLANSLTCRSAAALLDNEFGDASSFLEQAAKIFRDLGKPNEVAYCESKNLEAQAREFASVEDYEKASELILKASEMIAQNNEKLAKAYQGNSFLFLATHLKKRENYEEAIKYFEQGGQKFREANDLFHESMCRGRALECRAFLLKFDVNRNYKEIAQSFMKASQEYSKIPGTWAIVCNADAHKFLALDAKIRGARREAEQLFMKAKSFYYEALHLTTTLRGKQFFKSSVLWCEGMTTAIKAERLLLENISKRRKMNEVVKLLARSASLLSRASDTKKAEMISGLTHFAIAIDAFHDGNISKANAFVKEARSTLPPKFLHSVLVSEVRSDWQPLRYALTMLDTFDNYSRKLEAEKGLSFESRVRDLFRKMYTQYETIEEKTFNPKEDEIGIVFKDKTPVEVDALGVRKEGNRLLLLVGEAKNTSKPISFDEALKFVKKTLFVERRYAKIADLQSMEKPKVIEKVFISTSRLTPSAKELLLKNKVKVFEGNSVSKLFKRFHLFPLPQFSIHKKKAKEIS